MLQHKAAGAGRPGKPHRWPIVLAAHMDHPAFVLTGESSGDDVEAEFRGGVADSYFQDAAVRVYGQSREVSTAGRVVKFERDEHGEGRATLRLEGEASRVEAGDVATWDLPQPRVEGEHLYAPACDDLAGVAAALAAMDRWLASERRTRGDDLRVLLTRAEEVGFVGAIAACESGIIPGSKQDRGVGEQQELRRLAHRRRADRAGGRPHEHLRPRPHPPHRHRRRGRRQA